VASIERPGADEYAPYYRTYVSRVPEDDVLALLEAQVDELQRLLEPLPESQGAFRFAPDEWTIKEVVGHLIDAERVFAYRALTFARQEGVALPGFDQDAFVAAAGYGRRTLADLLDELVLLRRANVRQFRGLASEQSRRRGVASDNPVSVRALVYILAGHVDYHVEDLRTKYLPGLSPAG
jgi:hypothetical protein